MADSANDAMAWLIGVAKINPDQAQATTVNEYIAIKLNYNEEKEVDQRFQTFMFKQLVLSVAAPHFDSEKADCELEDLFIDPFAETNKKHKPKPKKVVMSPEEFKRVGGLISVNIGGGKK